MLIFLFSALVLIIFGLITLVGWQGRELSVRESVRESRMLTLQSQHTAHMAQLIREMADQADKRERNLRSEIQSLTEALGRSKEYVQVVYPRDEARPLESSSGWFDGKEKLRSVMKVGD